MYTYDNEESLDEEDRSDCWEELDLFEQRQALLDNTSKRGGRLLDRRLVE